MRARSTTVSEAATPELSIIVPLYNQLPLTRAMLDSLLATLPASLRFEVLLVDDGSTDGTRPWLAGLADPRLRVLLNERNLGYAASNNRAAAEARAPLLALLNNDLLLRPGWLEPMLAALGAPLAGGAAAGIVGNLQERALDGAVDHAGIAATRLGKLTHLSSLPPGAPALLPVLAVTGACCLLRREDFLKAGGFDTAYVNGCEDVDLCLRLRERGLHAVVATGSRIVHHVSASRGAAPARDEANSRLLYARWRDTLLSAVAEAWAAGPDARTAADAGLLARSALWREEARWAALLTQAPTPASAAPLACSGFNYVSLLASPSAPRGATVMLPPGLPRATLLVRCTRRSGLLARLLPNARLGLTVSINGLQTTAWHDLMPGRHTLAIDAPASLPDRPTSVVLQPLVETASGAPLGRLLRPLLARQLRFRRLVVDDLPPIELDRFRRT